MISVEAATELIQRNVPTMGSELLRLADLDGRVLAGPIHAPINLPVFTSSAVDGYAVRSEDLSHCPAYMELVASIAAGDEPKSALGPKQTIRVFTGSPVPEGADAVVMQEDVQVAPEGILFSRAVRSGSHVRYEGEEVRKGEEVLPAGVAINPAVLGVLSTLGITEANVYKRPRIAVIATGSELVPPGAPLRPGQIYESNAESIRAAVKCLAAETTLIRTCKDSLEEVREALLQALDVADAVVTCGGVSVGDHDVVRTAAEGAGVREVFWKVAMKPGKPFMFGLGPTGQPVFGLPGNAVSALVTFFLLVMPAIRKMMGLEPLDRESAVLAADVEKADGRAEFIRARRVAGSELTVLATECQGSHMLSGLALAEYLIYAPANSTHLAKGDRVTVIPLQWGLL